MVYNKWLHAINSHIFMNYHLSFGRDYSSQKLCHPSDLCYYSWERRLINERKRIFWMSFLTNSKAAKKLIVGERLISVLYENDSSFVVFLLNKQGRMLFFWHKFSFPVQDLYWELCGGSVKTVTSWVNHSWVGIFLNVQIYSSVKRWS